MSNEAVNWAFRQQCPSAGAKFVLVTLCDFADEEGFCYPSQKRLAALTQQAERTVRMHLAALEEAGLLRRQRRYNPDGTYKSDGFYIQRQNLPLADPADGKKQQRPAAKNSGIQRQDLPPNHQGLTPKVEPSGELGGDAVADPSRTRASDDGDGVSIPPDLSPGEEERAQMQALGIPPGWYGTKWWSIVEHYENKPDDRRTIAKWRWTCRHLISEDWAKEQARQAQRASSRASSRSRGP